MQKKEYYKHNLPHFQQPGQAYFVTWSLKDSVPKKALKRYSQKLEILKSQLGAGAADSMGAADSDPLFGKEADQNRNHPGAAVSMGTADSDPLFRTDADPRRHHLENHELEFATPDEKLQKEYYALRKKYIKAYNDLLDAERNPKIDLSKPENLSVMIDTLMFWEGKTLQNHAFCIMPNHVHWVFEVFEKDENGNPVYLQDILYSVKRFSANRINKVENRKGPLWQKESFDTTIRDEKHMYYAIEYTLNNPVNAGFVSDWRDWAGSWSAE